MKNKSIKQVLAAFMAFTFAFQTLQAEEIEGVMNIDFDLADYEPKLEIDDVPESIEKLISRSEVQKVIEQVVKEQMKDKKSARNIIAVYPSGKTRKERISQSIEVLGMKESDAISAVGNMPGDTACHHIQGNIANRWCHAAIVKQYTQSLKDNGVESKLASVIGSTFFVPKEYLMDLNPSMSDIAGTYTDSFGKRKEFEFEVTAFADGGFFLTLKKHLGKR